MESRIGSGSANSQTSKRKFYILLSLAFYAGYIAMAAILGEISPGGPCAPGAGAFLILALPFFTGTLLLVNLILVLSGKKDHLIPLFIHLGVMALLLVLMFKYLI